MVRRFSKALFSLSSFSSRYYSFQSCNPSTYEYVLMDDTLFAGVVSLEDGKLVLDRDAALMLTSMYPGSFARGLSLVETKSVTRFRLRDTKHEITVVQDAQHTFLVDGFLGYCTCETEDSIKAKNATVCGHLIALRLVQTNQCLEEYVEQRTVDYSDWMSLHHEVIS